MLQYFGVDILGAWPSGWRQPSFVGVSELGALGAAALAIGFVGPAGRARSSGASGAALAGGTVCVVLSGGIAAELAVVLAAVASVLLVQARDGVDWRRAGVIGALTVVCGLGVLGLRHGDLTQYARYIGLAKADESTNRDAQTFAQRELMYYLGIRVWRDRPILGAGWQSIREQQVYAPFLPDAHRRFSDQPEQAFPHELSSAVATYPTKSAGVVDGSATGSSTASGGSRPCGRTARSARYPAATSRWPGPPRRTSGPSRARGACRASFGLGVEHPGGLPVDLLGGVAEDRLGARAEQVDPAEARRCR